MKKNLYSLITKLLSIFACALVIIATPAYAINLADHHKDKSQECSACHTENMQTVPTTQTCLSCHDDYFDKTIEVWPNPHASPHLQPGEEPECTTCHKGHAPQTVTCQTCHENFEFKHSF